MGQYKMIGKNGAFQLQVKSRKEQHLNEREAAMINNGQLPGILPFSVLPGQGTFTLCYDLQGLMTLKNFLLGQCLSREAFMKILRDILERTEQIKTAHFSQQLLEFSADHVMIFPAQQRIFMIYVPIQPHRAMGSLQELLTELIRFGSFDPREDTQYVQEFIQIMNGGVVFSAFALQEYLRKWQDGGVREEAPGLCPGCGAPIGKEDIFCCACGKRLTQEPKKEKLDPAPPKPVASSRQFSVGEDAQGNVTVFRPAGNAGSGRTKKAFLRCSRTGEKIEITGDRFRLGKMAGATDYRIRDNNAVSRTHADILHRFGRYYILDLQSTNKTYVNGRAIPSGRETELASGTEIQLANEKFTFII